MTNPSDPACPYSDAFFVNLLRETVPEREAELNEIIGRQGISFIANYDESSMRFCVDTQTRQITVATSPLPRIWGHAYAYLRVYHLVSEAKSKDSKVSSISVANCEYAQAIDLLKWAMAGDAVARFVNTGGVFGPQAFPAGVPLPFDPAVDDEYQVLASHLAIMALGFILLHEIAHLELRHYFAMGPDSIAQEREADGWAAAFLLEKCDVYANQHQHEESDVRKKRLLALTMGELWMLHFEVHFGAMEGGTHPPTYDRLANLLGQQTGNAVDLAWAMAATILPLHYHARYDVVDKKDGFEDFCACYQYYADLLSKKPKRMF